MRRVGWILFLVVLTSACSRGDDTTFELSAEGQEESSTTTTTGPPATTTTAAAPATTSPPMTSPTSVPTTARTTVPKPATTTTVVATTTLPLAPTTVPITTPPPPPPLPVPVLIDAKQGIGTPCDAGGQAAGCFFFVYATQATKGQFHLLYSDAGYRSPNQMGSQCGTQSPHHPGEETCHWYIGPVQDRTAGQIECFWMTTVLGGRESEPSNHVCLTWSDHVPYTP